MSRLRPVIDKAARNDEWRSNVLRHLDKQGRNVELAREILAVLSEADARMLTTVDTNCHSLHCRAAACFVAGTREAALALFERLSPAIPLTFVRFKRGYSPEQQSVWPVTYENPKVTVVSREEIAPFVYTVSQGLNFGPLNELSWVVRTATGRQVAILCRIESDPAQFVRHERAKRVRVRQYDRATRSIMEVDVLSLAREFSWQLNDKWPKGYLTGYWNRWVLDGFESAFCSILWPLRKFGGPEGETQAQAARRLLEVREAKADGDD